MSTMVVTAAARVDRFIRVSLSPGTRCVSHPRNLGSGGTAMTINPGAAEFPHRQIAAQLRERIRRGDWNPGERLPSIPAMAGMFGVAKQTVQRTVDQLRVEGILITKPGSGTYVRGTRRRLNRLPRGRYGGFRGYHTDLAARYRQQLVSVGLSPAPAEVADAF